MEPEIVNARPDDELSDAELLSLAASKPEAFGVFYKRHIDAILAYHYRRSGCPQTAADLAAETFAQAFLSRRKFSPGSKPARAWLFGIARNHLGKFVRRQQVEERARRKLGVERIEVDESDIAHIEALVDMAPLRRELQEALTSLPAGEAKAVRMRIGQELTYTQVANILGCSEGAARVRVSRGLTKLADILEGT